MSSVTSVETVRPPTIAIPIGCQSSLPSPIPRLIGTIPRSVVSEVINTGRNLDFPPKMTACDMPIPLSRFRLM